MVKIPTIGRKNIDVYQGLTQIAILFDKYIQSFVLTKLDTYFSAQLSTTCIIENGLCQIHYHQVISSEIVMLFFQKELFWL